MQKVTDKVNYLTKGCRCTTGCHNKKCKCKKEELFCGPNCQCMNCMKNAQYISQQVDSEQEKQVIQEAQEDSNNDESKDSDYDDNAYYRT